jgi:hypothetical protein
MRLLPLAVLLSLYVAPASAQTYPYVIKTIAGVEPAGNGGPATAALLDFPWAVAVDNSNNVYIADGNGHGIRKINSAGVISAFSTIGAVDLKTDSAGNVYAADGVSTVYKITPAGVATVFAGGTIGFGGDQGPATSARLSAPSGIAFDRQGNLYIADTDIAVFEKSAAASLPPSLAAAFANLAEITAKPRPHNWLFRTRSRWMDRATSISQRSFIFARSLPRAASSARSPAPEAR